MTRKCLLVLAASATLLSFVDSTHGQGYRGGRGGYGGGYGRGGGSSFGISTPNFSYFSGSGFGSPYGGRGGGDFTSIRIGGVPFGGGYGYPGYRGGYGNYYGGNWGGYGYNSSPRYYSGSAPVYYSSSAPVYYSSPGVVTDVVSSPTISYSSAPMTSYPVTTYPSTTTYSNPSYTVSGMPSDGFSGSTIVQGGNNTHGSMPVYSSSANQYQQHQSMYPSSTGMSTQSQLRIVVPSADAQVWLGDQLSVQRTTERVFTFPSLTSGNIPLTIKATWNENGKPVTQERQTQVMPGQTATVSFSRTSAEAMPNPASTQSLDGRSRDEKVTPGTTTPGTPNTPANPKPVKDPKTTADPNKPDDR